MNDLDDDLKAVKADQSTQTRRGAASDTSNLSIADDLAFAPTPEDLPMVVWLVGTEPWFSEFTLEADHVMSSLGIKRTRLTQIAGRELRVGRVRRGRYISPVFRPEDVEQYLKWSRAPSTHIKSSTMLSEAAETLRQQADLLESQFSELKDGITSDFESGIRRAVLCSDEIAAANRAQIQRSFLQFSHQVAERILILGKRQDAFSEQVNQLSAVIEKLHAGQMAILQTLQESQVRSSTQMSMHAANLEKAVAQIDEKINAPASEGENFRINRAVLRAQKMLRPRAAYKKKPQALSNEQKKSKRVPVVRTRRLRSKV